jgi:hypothetical protein
MTPAAPAPAPTGRLGNGQLRRQVAQWLADHPGPHTPGEIHKDLGKSAGAIGNALTTLVGRGEADLASTKPLRDQARLMGRRGGGKVDVHPVLHRFGFWDANDVDADGDGVGIGEALGFEIGHAGPLAGNTPTEYLRPEPAERGVILSIHINLDKSRRHAADPMPARIKEPPAFPPGHLSWAVIDAVDELDLGAFLAYYRCDGKGRPACHPKMMTSLVLYCYCEGIRSSRAVEMACLDDVGCRVTTGNIVRKQRRYGRERSPRPSCGR